MSLVLNAAPWSSSGTRKRTPTLQRSKKTIKTAPVVKDDDSDSDDDESTTNVSESFTDALSTQQSRNEKVGKIIDKITSAGDGLADFVPLASPDDPPVKHAALNDLLPAISRHEGTTEGFQAPLYMHDYDAHTGASELLSNYEESYLAKPYYATQQMPATSNNVGAGNVMQKLNYITHILEELQMEKTSNITEEFILYAFLGVFVIFIVDSFAKAGKYHR
jgi:hypothetical protein